MANEAHYAEFLKLINVHPNDVTNHITQRYQDFVNFFENSGHQSVEQAFQNWCKTKALEQPSIPQIISPIKNSFVWDTDFTEIIETIQSSSSPIKRLPTLPSPEVNKTKRVHSSSPSKWEVAKRLRLSPLPPIHTPPPPPPSTPPPHTKHIVGQKTMENLNKLKQKMKKNRKTVGRPSRMKTLSKLANNTTLFQKTLYLVDEDKKVKKTLPILTTGNNNLQCTDENNFKIFEYITKERKTSLETIQKEKEKLVNIMHIEEKLNCQEQNSTTIM